MFKRTAAGAICVALIALVCPPALAAREPVRTESGLVEGLEQDGVVSYRGIPFAAPPIANLRWRAPQPAQPWPGVRKADHFAPACTQKGSYPEDAPPERSDEDCLYLNVWAPASARDEKRAVLVWIYGGALRNGSASIPLYAGDQLARKDVVVVTANYRLGVFGFLAHPELTRESEHRASGNYGLLDQLAALSWVKRNIAAFGGDPGRITVAGQSSGAISISALLASPLSEGLIHRAIGQSGGLFEPMEVMPELQIEGAEKVGENFAARAGVKTLAELRGKAASDLLDVPFHPQLIVDGYVLTQPPAETYRAKRQRDVPILIGSNRDEGELFLAGRTITRENFRQELDQDFPSWLVGLIGPQPGATDAQARASAAAFHRDIRFGWDMWTWAALTAQRGSMKVFAYEFTRSSPREASEGPRGATHGAEMPYVFDHLDQKPLAWSAEDRRLSATMSSYWTNFAKSGDPNGPGLPPWPAFTESGREGLLLGDTINPSRVFDSPYLPRIDRVYAAVRAIIHHKYLVLGAATALVIALMWLLVRSVRALYRAKINARLPENA